MSVKDKFRRQALTGGNPFRKQEDNPGEQREDNPGGQRAITKKEYESLIPRLQGYASYMQGAWNPEVPEECPYAEGTPEREEWANGAMSATLEAQDMEE